MGLLFGEKVVFFVTCFFEVDPVPPNLGMAAVDITLPVQFCLPSVQINEAVLCKCTFEVG